MGDTLDKFLAFAAPASFQALQKYNDNQVLGQDLAQFAKDPTYRIDPSKYANPETAIAADTHLKGLRDFKQQEAANPLLDTFSADYQRLAGSDKRFYADPESRAVLKESGLQEPDATSNPYVRKGLQDFAKQAQLENDLADNFANPGDVNSLARLGANPLAQAQHNIVGTLQTSQDKAATREQAAAKEAAASQVKQDISGFQGDIAGLTGPSTSPNDLARFAKRGGYAPFSEVESDIRQAAASRGVGDSPEVNKAVTDARSLYEKTMLPPQTVHVGRTTATGQTNLLGDFRKDVTSTAPIIHVNTGPKPGTGRMQQAIDTQNGNRLVFIDAGSLMLSNQENPGRYIPAAAGAQALGKTALAEDIKGSITALRGHLANLTTDFDAKQRAQLNLVFKDRDPKSAMSNFMGSTWASTLSPDQQDYVIGVLQLKEQAMAMRSMLGAGAGSDAQRNAIFQTIPGAGTSSKQYAYKQLNQFEEAVNRISRGIPSVPLREEKTPASGKKATGISSFWK